MTTHRLLSSTMRSKHRSRQPIKCEVGVAKDCEGCCSCCSSDVTHSSDSVAIGDARSQMRQTSGYLNSGHRQAIAIIIDGKLIISSVDFIQVRRSHFKRFNASILDKEADVCERRNSTSSSFNASYCITDDWSLRHNKSKVNGLTGST